MPRGKIYGYRHFYEDVGSGEPIVVLHGIMNSSRYFMGIIPDLALDFRVIAPDLRAWAEASASGRCHRAPGPAMCSPCPTPWESTASTSTA